MADAGKKKKKKQPKKNSAPTTQVEQAPVAKAGPSKAVQNAFDHLRAYDTNAAREALEAATDDDAYAMTAQQR